MSISSTSSDSSSLTSLNNNSSTSSSSSSTNMNMGYNTSTNSSSSSGPALAVGGLVSGLDTNSIIDGLTAIENEKVTRVQNQAQSVTNTQSAFTTLTTELGTMSTAAEQLQDPTNWNLYTSNSNYPSNVTISGTTGATPGNYAICCTQLATSETVASKPLTSLTNPMGVSGTIQIGTCQATQTADPTATSVSINVLASDAPVDIVKKINAAPGTGVTASLLTLSDGTNRILLNAVDAGANGINISDTAGSVLSSSLGLTNSQQKQVSTFALLNQGGGPAQATDTVDTLATGIGANSLTDGDVIHITGTDSNGNAVSADVPLNVTGTDSSLKQGSGPNGKTTVADIIAGINSAFVDSSGNPTATATLNNDGQIELVDTAKGTGTMSFSLSLTSANNSSLGLGKSAAVSNMNNVINPGGNAFFTLDGMAVTSKTNAASGLISGTTFNLLQATPGTATSPKITANVSLSVDTNSLTSKIEGFVNAYNNVIAFINQNSQINVQQSTSTTGSSSASSIQVGYLYGDSNSQSIKDALQTMITNSIPELNSQTQYTALSMIGITTSSANDGTLTVDSTALATAMNTDLNGVKDLFAATSYSSNPNFVMGHYTDDTKTGTYSIDAAKNLFDQNADPNIDSKSAGSRSGQILLSTGGDSKGLSITATPTSGTGTFTFVRGFASQFVQWYDQASDPVNGTFLEANNDYAQQIKDLNQQASDLQTQSDAYQANLQQQFSNMEQQMNTLKSQSSAFASL